jgi:hypothetical protein
MAQSQRRKEWGADLTDEQYDKWKRRSLEEMRLELSLFGGEPTTEAERQALAKREAWERAQAERRSTHRWIIGSGLEIASILAAVAVAYYFQSPNVPELTSTGGSLDWRSPGTSGSFQWQNTGKKPARRGIATLYALDKDRAHQKKLGEAPITGAGTNVIPRYNGQAKIYFETEEVPDTLLVCTIYFDETKEYHQAFLFRRLGPAHPEKPGTISIEEIAPPNYKEVCQ